MTELRVNLTKRITTEDGKRKFIGIPTLSRKEAQKAAKALPEGIFYLDWYVDGVRKREAVGTDLEAALAAHERKTHCENAVASGAVSREDLKDGQKDNSGKTSLRAAVKEYLDDIRSNKKKKTLQAYTVALDYFLQSCHKDHIEDITRKDMIRFSAYLRDEQELSPRSVYNKFESVMTGLGKMGKRWEDLNAKDRVGPHDWPQYTEEVPEIYTDEDRAAFFRACDATEMLWFSFFLYTGMREQEVMYAYWSDIDFESNAIKVSRKAELNWDPKRYKERQIPMHSNLRAVLLKWRDQRAASCKLVFPTTGCKPKGDFLDCCKAIAKRARLNPEDFWLHKFRATFATKLLWNGEDLRTVQAYMGHTDLESTMRYLRPKPLDKKTQSVLDTAF